jgi:hypothetical protein
MKKKLEQRIMDDNTRGFVLTICDLLMKPESCRRRAAAHMRRRSFGESCAPRDHLAEIALLIMGPDSVRVKFVADADELLVASLPVVEKRQAPKLTVIPGGKSA